MGQIPVQKDRQEEEEEEEEEARCTALPPRWRTSRFSTADSL
jgi:hypothetical protein